MMRHSYFYFGGWSLDRLIFGLGKRVKFQQYLYTRLQKLTAPIFQSSRSKSRLKKGLRLRVIEIGLNTSKTNKSENTVK